MLFSRLFWTSLWVKLVYNVYADYPKIEAAAKALAKELEIDHDWKDIHFREARKEDQQIIRATLEDAEAIPANCDWAVKMGINLYYSANLSKSPLYSKQMPYNAVIYKAFGRNSPNHSPTKLKASGGRRAGRQKKIAVAGRWCGKVWMANQVHPFLACRNREADDAEFVESLCSRKVDRKPEFDPDTDHGRRVAPSTRKGNNATTARKLGRKRKKKPLKKTNTKRPRNSKEGTSGTMDIVAEPAVSPCGRVLRSSRTKCPEKLRQNSLKCKDELEDGTRPRIKKHPSRSGKNKPVRKQIMKKKTKKNEAPSYITKDDEGGEYTCDIEGCSMTFSTKQDLATHKRDICPVKGCLKKFFSHKYLVQHRKVHMDDRPLECPWKGCKRTFKWPWARTEHIRVHTGDRPYVCREPGCGQTFRFVSDFSRHKRKTGHSVKKSKR